MASVDWQKATTQKAGGMIKHLGQEERENGNHSNEHINKELAHLNYSIGCNNYREAFQQMKERTAEVDEIMPPQRIRKDRVTCCFLEVPCPREITEQGRADEFFEKTHELYKEFFGEKNVHGTFVHKDEVHEYLDKSGNQQMSCEHAHTLVSAFTEGKGINGKAFETRGRLNALNKAMSEMCAKEFGVQFNTGEKADRKSVETLKQESEARKELGELKSKALEYEPAPMNFKDIFNKKGYEEKVKLHQQAVAVKQGQAENEKMRAELISRQEHIDREVRERAEKLSKTLTVKRLEGERDKVRVERDKALKAHREALTRVQELERDNANKERYLKNVWQENEALRQEVEELNFELTGEALTYDEIHKSDKKKGMER